MLRDIDLLGHMGMSEEDQGNGVTLPGRLKCAGVEGREGTAPAGPRPGERHQAAPPPEAQVPAP